MCHCRREFMPSAHLARIEVSAGHFLSALSSGSLAPRTISIYEIFQNVTLMCVCARLVPSKDEMERKRFPRSFRTNSQRCATSRKRKTTTKSITQCAGRIRWCLLQRHLFPFSELSTPLQMIEFDNNLSESIGTMLQICSTNSARTPLPLYSVIWKFYVVYLQERRQRSYIAKRQKVFFIRFFSVLFSLEWLVHASQNKRRNRRCRKVAEHTSEYWNTVKTRK